MKKRLFALLLAAALVLSLGAAAPLAEEEGPEQTVSTASEPAEPEVAEPETTEPEATEPEAAEPEATEPEATEPEATEPEVTEPEATEPEATEPEATEPETTEPEVTEPEATEPEATEPEAAEPETAALEPTETETTEITVVYEGPEGALTDVKDSDGNPVTFPAKLRDGQILTATLAPGYAVYPSSEINSWGTNEELSLRFSDYDGDNTVTIRVVQTVTLTVRLGDGVPEEAINWISIDGGSLSGSGTAEIAPGSRITVALAGEYTVLVEGASIGYDDYYILEESLHYRVDLTAGEGDIVITVVKDEDAPVLFPITYEDDEGLIDNYGHTMTFAGDSFSVEVKNGYVLEVEGGFATNNGGSDYTRFRIDVDDGAESLVIRPVPAKEITVILDGPKDALTDVKDSDGNPVTFPAKLRDGQVLTAALASGYAICPSREINSREMDGELSLRLSDYDGDDTVTIRVVQTVTLTVQLGDGVPEEAIDSIFVDGGWLDGPGTLEIVPGGSITVALAGEYTVLAEGASIDYDGYYISEESLHYRVGLTAGEGDVVITVVKDEDAPAVIPVIYKDDEGLIENQGYTMTFAGDSFSVEVKDGYVLEVEGGSAYALGGSNRTRFNIDVYDWAESLVIRPVPAREITVVYDGPKDALTGVKDSDGNPVTFPAKLRDGQILTAALAPGYAINPSSEVDSWGKNEELSLRLSDYNGNNTVTIRVVQTVTLTVRLGDGVPEEAIDRISIDGGSLYGPGTLEIVPGGSITVALAGEYTVLVEGAGIYGDDYSVEGESLCHTIDLTAGEGDVVITVVKDEDAPVLFPVTYEDDEGLIDNYGQTMTFAGDSFSVEVKDGYVLEVEGGSATDNEGGVNTWFHIDVDDGAESLVIRPVPAKEITVVYEGPKDALTDVKDSDGNPVTFPAKLRDGQVLTAALASGYAIYPSREINSWGMDGELSLRLSDYDGDDTVTIRVVQTVTLTVRLGDGVPEKAISEIGVLDGPGTAEIAPGSSIYVYLAGKYTVLVEGASIGYDDYYVSGESLRHTIDLTAGEGDVVITVVKDENAPALFPITYEDDEELIVIDNYGQTMTFAGDSFRVEVKNGYVLEVEGGSAYAYGRGMFGIDVDDGAESLVIRPVPAREITVTYDGSDGVLTNVRDSGGNPVTFPAKLRDAETLTATLAPGYAIRESSEVSSWQMSGKKVSILLFDRDGNGAVTIQTAQTVKLVMDDPGHHFNNYFGFGESALVGERLWVAVDVGYAVEAENGIVDFYGDGYGCDSQTGEVYKEYFVIPNGEGDLILHVVEDAGGEPAPTATKIEYVDTTGVISGGPNYMLSGIGMSLTVKKGYTVKAEPEESASVAANGDGSFILFVTGDAVDCVTVTAVKLAAGAKLQVTGAGLAPADSVAGGSTPYLQNGSTLKDGSGYLLVKNGYDLAFGQTEGCQVDLVGYIYEGPGKEIYKRYMIRALEDTARITLTEGEKAWWVEATVKNPDGVMFNFDTYVSGTAEEYTRDDALWKSPLLLSDGYLHIKVYDPGYKVTVTGGTVYPSFDETEFIISDLKGDGDVAEVTIEIVERTGMLGDMDESGTLSIKDVLLLLRSTNQQQFDPNGDMDGSGTLSIKDVLLLLKQVNSQEL